MRRKEEKMRLIVRIPVLIGGNNALRPSCRRVFDYGIF